jgi:hypothetical protein
MLSGRVSVLLLLLQATSCRAPHELELFEGKAPKPPPAMPAPCPPDPALASTCAECTTEAECGAAKPVCVTGRCVACTADEHCQKDRACNTATTECAKRCAQNEECTDKEAKVCNPTAAYCVECVTDPDCTKPDRSRCETQTGSCVACLDDSDCMGATLHCSPARVCVQCLADEQCPDAGTCDLERTKCAPPEP